MRGVVGVMVVEVGNVLGRRVLKVALIDDQYPVEQLMAEGADPSFGDRVCPRCLHRCVKDVDAFAGEDRVEGVGERAVAIRGWRVRPGSAGNPRSSSLRPTAAPSCAAAVLSSGLPYGVEAGSIVGSPGLGATARL